MDAADGPWDRCLDCEGPLVPCTCQPDCPGYECAQRCGAQPRPPAWSPPTPEQALGRIAAYKNRREVPIHEEWIDGAPTNATDCFSPAVSPAVLLAAAGPDTSIVLARQITGAGRLEGLLVVSPDSPKPPRASLEVDVPSIVQLVDAQLRRENPDHPHPEERFDASYIAPAIQFADCSWCKAKAGTPCEGERSNECHVERFLAYVAQGRGSSR